MQARRVVLWRLRWLILFASVTVVRAQLNRGIVEGIVTDPQGAVVPEVDVSVTNTETDVTARTKTNTEGYYRAVDLVPGKYLVHFANPGFARLT